jgi:hypothetical protein
MNNEHSFTPAELRKLRSLKDPYGIQRFLDDMPYHLADTAWSPRRVLRENTSHCFEGAIFAAAALRANGYPPFIIDFEAEHDTDHVLAIYRIKGHWGAIGKSNYAGCRYREPVYRSLRELAQQRKSHRHLDSAAKTVLGLADAKLIRHWHRVSHPSGR